MLVLTGLVLLVAPGPGFLLVFVGAAMIAEESLWFARAFDALELKVRRLAARTRRRYT